MKTIRLLLLIITILFFNVNLMAQYGRQYGSRTQGRRIQNSRQQARPSSKVQPKNVSMFIVYNSETVFKKIKLRDKSKIKTLGAVLENYNNKIIEIKAFESEPLNVAKTYIKQKQKEAQQSGDYSIMQEARVRVKEIIAPLQQKLKNEQNLLNLKFKKDLTPKQFEKWLRYQDSKHQPKSVVQNRR